jgi:hypothetical protein
MQKQISQADIGMMMFGSALPGGTDPRDVPSQKHLLPKEWN